MNITLMEKTYKENKVVLYVNGFVGVVSDKSMLEDAMKVLQHLDYNIKDVNFVSCPTDEVPNNEANYWHEGESKNPVYLKESTWIHQCKKGCCMSNGYKLNVNGAEVNIIQSLLTEIGWLLCNLGHPLTAVKKPLITLCKPGLNEGDCIEKISEQEEFEAFNQMMLDMDSSRLELEDTRELQAV